jgi:hypothetical protein
MAKYVLLVQSSTKEGRDAEYEAWYDAHHLSDMCAIPGVSNGRRLVSTPVAFPEAGKRHLGIFDVETDDLGAFMAEMNRIRVSGQQSSTDSLDRESIVLWIYEDKTPEG